MSKNADINLLLAKLIKSIVNFGKLNEYFPKNYEIELLGIKVYEKCDIRFIHNFFYYSPEITKFFRDTNRNFIKIDTDNSKDKIKDVIISGDLISVYTVGKIPEDNYSLNYDYIKLKYTTDNVKIYFSDLLDILYIYDDNSTNLFREFIEKSSSNSFIKLTRLMDFYLHEYYINIGLEIDDEHRYDLLTKVN